ncbi:MAG: cobaltochelatase subunit CobN [Deltaproteobacteria bacterium]|jgi:cobaltochelatase CobN|nr:cobaltochelatase subunit CobN [Deltaproteobacteria bacterium]
MDENTAKHAKDKNFLDLVYFSATGMETGQLSAGLTELRKRRPDLDVRVSARTAPQLFDESRIREFLRRAFSADVLVIALHGPAESFPGRREFEEEMAKEGGKPLVHVQASASDADGLAWAAKHSTLFGSGEYSRAHFFLNAGGRENFGELLLFFHNQVLGTKFPVKDPVVPPFDGIHHPSLASPPDKEEYLKSLDPEKPVVGIWFHQVYWLNGNMAHIDSLIREIENQGAQALPVFHLRFKDKDLQNLGADAAARKYFMDESGKSLIDCLLSTMSFSLTLTSPDARGLFKDLNVPVIQAMCSFQPRESWRESLQGLPAAEVSMSAAQPEFDGNIIAFPFAFREQRETDPLTRALVTVYEADPERTAKMARFAVNWARLRRAPASERKIAVIFHHHPPRNDRIGCAAGLDSFRSVTKLLKALKDEGYKVDDLYEGEDELARALLSRLTADRSFLTPELMSQRAEARAGRKDYVKWHMELPEEAREKTLNDWGELPGELFTHQGEMLFPGIPNGNVFIGIQPPRGRLENIEKIYHDDALSPPHHYLAQYRWYRDVWGAQALVHVGKHGSLEWLPGKALGLSGSCFPDLAIMDLPNVYPYIINDPGEGAQAKRRSYACVVDHLPPAMTVSGLYGDLEKIDALLAERRLAETEDPKKLPIIEEQILQAVKEADLGPETALRETEEDFPAYLERLHGYLDELSDTAVGDGLHVLGEPPEGPRLSEYLAELTRVEGPGAPSLRENFLKSLGLDYELVLENRGKIHPGFGGRTGAEILRSARESSLKLLEGLREEGFDPAAVPRAVADLKNRGGLEILNPGPLEEALFHVCRTLVPNLERTTGEIDSALKALRGGFVEPGPSGAPSRGQTDILPTGRNFYSVDPNKIPSPAAWKIGVALGDALIERSLQENGKYPENVGILLYGASTMRTRGDDVAEVYHLMGLKPVWREGGTVSGLEVVPLGELGRPRLDVTPRISGFFRDSFPNLVETLDKAVDMTARLKEDPGKNFVKRHAEADYKEYLAQGLKEGEAWREATFRIFGCPPGTYGAGVAELVESKKWEKREDLGEIYVRYSGHAYGKGSYGLVRPRSFRRNLARMDVTVKNEDSREYDMMSCTDYYNYYGGLIAAVETVRGAKPLSFMGDAADPKRVRIRTTQEEAKHVLRSRLINPKWLSGMKRHGYKGAGDVSHMMDAMFGWDATADVMEDWMYQKVAEAYALDPETREWMERVNPFARRNILDKLLEASARGMWRADESTLESLKEEYLELEGRLEEWNDETPRKDVAL